MAGTTLIFDILAKDRASGTFKAFGREIDALGKKARGLSQLGDFGGKLALGATAGLAAVIGVTANFEKSMSGVKAATGEGEAGMKALRDAALQAGADTAFSASEAAAGMTALSKAGVATQDILDGGLTGALDLAAAGELDVANAAEIAATTMTQFSLAGSDVSHIADVLAASAGKAQGEVTDMAGALKYVGPVAAQMGISLEETAGSIAYLASQGIVGQQAGTSLRGMLTALTSPSAAAKDQMDALGISMYDAQGQFVGLDGLAGQLQQTMGSLTNAERDEALGRIFGNEQITAARILYAGGAEAVEKWTGAVNDSGYASEQAATKLDNLAGDFEALTGSVETALIGMGSGSQGALRSIVQGMTDTVNAFADLPGPAQNGVTAVLGLTAALGGTVFAASKVASGMGSAVEALTNMGMSAERAQKAVSVMSRAMGAAAGVGLFAVGMSNANESLGSFMATIGGAAAGGAIFGPWGAALGGAAGLFASLAHNAEDATGAIDAFTAALDQQTGALTENNRQLAQKQLQDSGAFEAAERLGLDLALVTDAALGNADAIAELNAQMGDYGAIVRSAGGSKGSFSAGYNENAHAADQLWDEINKVNDVVQNSTDKFNQNKEAAGDAANGIDNASGAAGNAGPRFEAMSKALKASRASARSTAKEFFGLGDSLDDNKTSLAEWIRDMEDSADALRNFRKNAQKAAKEGLDEGLIDSLNEAGPAGALRMRQLANATDAEIKRANKAWRSGQSEVNKYTNAIGGVPERVNTDVNVNTGDALPKVHGLISALSNVRDKTVHITTIFERHNIDLSDDHGGGTPRGRVIPGERGRLSATYSAYQRASSARVADGRRVVVEVQLIPGEMDFSRAKAQINGAIRAISRDEIDQDRNFSETQR